MPSTDISYTTRDNETFTGYLAERMETAKCRASC